MDLTAISDQLEKYENKWVAIELGKNAYSLFDQKQITAWLDLRNNAAHGNYTDYDEFQVAKLIDWVGDFISKNPA